MKEPPDKYRCIKVPITSILYNNDDNEKIFNCIQDAVYRTNYITTKSSLLLRLWCLEKFHNGIVIPLITENTINMCMKSLLLPSSGRKPTEENNLLLNEFKKLHNFKLENGVNLSAIKDYYATAFLTSIENNIKMHFFDYINRFINSYFKVLYKNELNDKEFKKQLFKDLYVVKNDIINGTLNANEKFHNWINNYRYKIVPEDFEVNYYYDVKSTPQKYLKYMIFMNIELEKIEGKMYQFFPIQSSIIPNHIQIDTKALIELLVKEDKQPLLKNIELNKEFLWDKFFDIKHKMKNYIFNHTIITDGYVVSLRFLHNDYIEEEKIKVAKKKKGKLDVKGLTKEQKETRKNDKKKLQEEKKKVKKEEYIKNKPKKIEKPIEFPYIDDVDKEELKGNHIFIDPGKRTLLNMMNDDGKFFSYTNKQRISETKRLKYQTILKKYKDELNITPIENELSSFNSKSCNLTNYNNFITKKLSTNEILYKMYQDDNFRRYKWYSYINKKRTEDRMLNKIEKVYGKDSIVVIGDWSIGKQMKNFISTPNISIKRKLQERFRVYDIDEYRTSCLNYKTEEVCNNLYLHDKKNKERKMHSILTYKMENKRFGCINRDINGCKNIQKIFNHYILYNERPEKYKRGYDLKQKLPTVLNELSNGGIVS